MDYDFRNSRLTLVENFVYQLKLQKTYIVNPRQDSPSTNYKLLESCLSRPCKNYMEYVNYISTLSTNKISTTVVRVLAQRCEHISIF